MVAARKRIADWRCIADWRPIAGRKRGKPDRVENLLVAGAAAQVSGQAIADLLIGWIGKSLQELARRQDHSWRADSALRAARFRERLLHRVQLSIFGQAFHGHDF